MRTRRAVALAAGLACVAFLAADAAAMYHPTVGRWLSRDPIRYRAGMNLYQYVAGAPTDWRDPAGLWGAADHTGLTGGALDEAFPQERSMAGDVTSDPLGDQETREWIRRALVAGNLSQDQGEAFKDPHRHYNRSPSETPEEANAGYTTRLCQDTSEFYAQLDAVDPPCDTDAERQACRAAMEALARLTHAWEDYFAHAVLQDGAAGPAWSKNPPVTGDPDNPNPDLKPSSWPDDQPGWKISKGYGEHGITEPADRDKSGKQSGRQSRHDAAKSFAAEKLREYLPQWLEKCKCCIPK